MTKMTLEQHLLDYLSKKGDWVRKGELYNIADQEGYSPETCGRTLRTLAEKGTIFVEYYKGKRGQKLAKYSYTAPLKQREVVTIRDGKAYIHYEKY